MACRWLQLNSVLVNLFKWQWKFSCPLVSGDYLKCTYIIINTTILFFISYLNTNNIPPMWIKRETFDPYM